MQIFKKLYSDTNKRKSLSFSIPLDGSNVFNSVYNTKDVIKYNLINYLLTNKNERVFNLGFGADLRSLLFEGINLNELYFLQDKIQENIKFYFPDIEILELKFVPYLEENKLVFIFNYRIIGYGIEDIIEINIQ